MNALGTEKVAHLCPILSNAGDLRESALASNGRSYLDELPKEARALLSVTLVLTAFSSDNS